MRKESMQYDNVKHFQAVMKYIDKAFCGNK